jgi:hypothetical protein
MNVEPPSATRPFASRLMIALAAAVLATTLVAVVAIIRTGPSRWLFSLGRIVVMVLLSVLVLRGIRWARWVLIVWLSFSAIMFMAYSFAVAAYPSGIALFIAMTAIYIWTVVELTKADIFAPEHPRH